MAKLTISKVLLSGGYGGLDIALEEFAPAPVLGPLTGPDIERLVVAAGSGIANWMGYEDDYSEVLFYSSLPLAEKTIFRQVRAALGPVGVRSVISARNAGFTRIPAGLTHQAPSPRIATIE